MSHLEIRQRGRTGGQCPAGMDEDLAEVEEIILALRAEYDEKFRMLEGLVGTLTSAVAANQLRLGHCEAFNAALGTLSKALSVEGERFTNSE